jgi:hypothetical protein
MEKLIVKEESKLNIKPGSVNIEMALDPFFRRTR